ncbi:hypothetical protein EMCRGX_G010137 [Ephydatia muelleri]
MLVRRKVWSQQQTFQVNSVRPDQNFDTGLVLALACACLCSRHVSNQGVICIQKAARMEGSSDVEGDLVGEVYKYLVSGKYCDGASRERKRTIRKKALKFSVSNKGELLYRQKRKGKAKVLLRYIQSAKEQRRLPFPVTLTPHLATWEKQNSFQN